MCLAPATIRSKGGFAFGVAGTLAAPWTLPLFRKMGVIIRCNAASRKGMDLKDDLQGTSQGPCLAQVLGVRVDPPPASVLGIKETI